MEIFYSDAILSFASPVQRISSHVLSWSQDRTEFCAFTSSLQSSSSTAPAGISDINQSCVPVVESSFRFALILSAHPVI